jgi:hypothetical protein
MARDDQAHPVATILLAIKDRLVEQLQLSPSYVRIVASDGYELQCHDARFIYLRAFGPVPAVDVGVGRRARPVKRVVRLYLYTRNSLDETGADDAALTAAGAHLAFEDEVFDALDEWWPVTADDADTALTIEPLHTVAEGSGRPERKPEEDVGLVRSHIDLEIQYVLSNQNPIA